VPETDLLEAVDHQLVERAETVDPDDAPYPAALVAADAELLWTRNEAFLGAFEGLAVRVVPGP
jgi:predicted nucleic acid-binding protein